MNDQIKNIKENLEHLELTPSNSVWQKIESMQITPKPIPFYQSTAFKFGVIGTVAALVIAVLYFNNISQQNESIQQNEPTLTELITQNSKEQFEPQNAVVDSIPIQEDTFIESSPDVKSEVPEEGMLEPVVINKSDLEIEIVEMVSDTTAQMINQIDAVQNIDYVELKVEKEVELPKAEIVVIGTPREISVSNDTAICKDQSVKLYAQGGESYQWNTGSNDSIIEVRPAFSSVYSVRIIDHLNKETSKSIRVEVKECLDFYIPNSFTPNGDGHNDRFRPVAEQLEAYEIQIFSESGNMVYKSNQIHEGWDGKYAGEAMPAGIFVYVINYTAGDKKKKTKKGYIILIR